MNPEIYALLCGFSILLIISIIYMIFKGTIINPGLMMVAAGLLVMPLVVRTYKTKSIRGKGNYKNPYYGGAKVDYDAAKDIYDQAKRLDIINDTVLATDLILNKQGNLNNDIKQVHPFQKTDIDQVEANKTLIAAEKAKNNAILDTDTLSHYDKAINRLLGKHNQNQKERNEKNALNVEMKKINDKYTNIKNNKKFKPYDRSAIDSEKQVNDKFIRINLLNNLNVMQDASINMIPYINTLKAAAGKAKTAAGKAKTAANTVATEANKVNTAAGKVKTETTKVKTARDTINNTSDESVANAANISAKANMVILSNDLTAINNAAAIANTKRTETKTAETKTIAAELIFNNTKTTHFDVVLARFNTNNTAITNAIGNTISNADIKNIAATVDGIIQQRATDVNTLATDIATYVASAQADEKAAAANLAAVNVLVATALNDENDAKTAEAEAETALKAIVFKEDVEGNADRIDFLASTVYKDKEHPNALPFMLDAISTTSSNKKRIGLIDGVYNIINKSASISPVNISDAAFESNAETIKSSKESKRDSKKIGVVNKKEVKPEEVLYVDENYKDDSHLAITNVIPTEAVKDLVYLVTENTSAQNSLDKILMMVAYAVNSKTPITLSDSEIKLVMSAPKTQKSIPFRSYIRHGIVPKPSFETYVAPMSVEDIQAVVHMVSNK